MHSTPTYLHDKMMPIYRYALIFSFMLGFASLLAGIGFSIFTYAVSDLSFFSSVYIGFILFLKGVAIASTVSFLSFFAFWNKYQLRLESCQSQENHNCFKLRIFDFA
ncbi:hypothetical protein JHD50_08040 [Sulfurimonas sp. MAG313]|nr:hypothetical protein [Sulfurimonas sp. MAG313]MDF1881251.1 hypothetical protein [Sulfurimonas sp. MAG313]